MSTEDKISTYVAYHKPIEGTIGDNTGHDIRSLNPLFCALTVRFY